MGYSYAEQIVSQRSSSTSNKRLTFLQIITSHFHPPLLILSNTYCTIFSFDHYFSCDHCDLTVRLKKYKSWGLITQHQKKGQKKNKSWGLITQHQKKNKKKSLGSNYPAPKK